MNKVHIFAAANSFAQDPNSPGHWEIIDNQVGIRFTDEDEFIPLVDMGCNRDYGFFKLSRFPDLESDFSNEETL